MEGACPQIYRDRDAGTAGVALWLDFSEEAHHESWQTGQHLSLDIGLAAWQRVVKQVFV
jgi:hypothetical protein